MFLEDKDYKVVCTDEVLDIITQSDPENRIRAELSAQEEAEGYLRSRYDTCKAFAQQGADRNPMLVRVVVSIALYYLGQSLPQYMGDERQCTTTLSHGSRTCRAERPCPTCRSMNPKRAKICRIPCGSDRFRPDDTGIKHFSKTCQIPIEWVKRK